MKNGYYKIKFYIILMLTILPIFIFLLISNFYHDLYDIPSVSNGVLDLDGYDLVNNLAVPLDGEWEFFQDKRIVTDHLQNEEPDQMIKVPASWNDYSIDDKKRDNRGVGSYRIKIRNCPDTIKLISYIPSSVSRYQVYMNGILVAGKGDMEYYPPIFGFLEKTGVKRSVEGFCGQFRQGIYVNRDTEVNLVIEMASPPMGGLYTTPILSEENTDSSKAIMNNHIKTSFIGMIFITIGGIFCIILMKNKYFFSIALLIMDLLVLLKIVGKNDSFLIVKDFISISELGFTIILQTITLFMPVVFLFCAYQLVKIQISKKQIILVGVYELFFSIFILICSIWGTPRLQLILCIISYVPFVYIMRRIYCSVREGTPYTLTVSAILMFTLSSMVDSNLNASGYLLSIQSLYPTACFIISLSLQFWMYFNKNRDAQNDAVEAENLRLRLKESKMDLMLSQIQPHFIYNSLTAIHMLCTEDPETAAESVLKFAVFFRTNMNFINSRDPIPFEQELKHIVNYVDIEKMRFQKRLNMQYDIQCNYFLVPPLTIQPLVENAIKHGVCKNIRGGTVILKTCETNNSFHIEVIDDGPGFDTAILDEITYEPHGIHNITFRLKEWMTANIIIESSMDHGTRVRIRLPKGDQYENYPSR